MDAIKMLKERRSIRKFKDEKVSRELMKEVIEVSKYAPSWGNFQVARYALIDNQEIIQKIAHDGVKGFVYNMDTLKKAKGVAILSFVKGKSGKLDDYGLKTSDKSWEVFDSGIACQQFCLASHAKGVGTVIMGVIDDKEIAKIVNLPEEETVAAVIVYGYPEGKHPKPTPRKSTEKIMRFVD